MGHGNEVNEHVKVALIHTVNCSSSYVANVFAARDRLKIAALIFQYGNKFL